MPKSRSRTRARVIRAGLTTGVVGAALLVAPHAAFAATTSPPVVAPGGTVTITDTAVNLSTAAAVQITTLTTCNATFTTPTTTIVNASGVTATSTTLSFTVPGTLTAGTNGQARRYTACAYAGAVAATSTAVGTAYPVYVGTPPAVSPAVGITGGGNLVTVTAPENAAIFTNITSIGAVFSIADCPATYGTPATGTATTATRVSNTSATLTVPTGVVATGANPTSYNLCLYSGAVTASPLISGVTYQASLLALSQSVGPWGGGNGLNVTSPTAFLAGIATPGVVFERATAACPATYVTSATLGTEVTVAAANVRRLADTRMAVTVPALRANDTGLTGPEAWRLCVYNGQTVGASALIASTAYAITVVPTATSVTPKAGPALGGSRITVSGTAFPTTAGSITATLGGTPLTNITPISSTAFTAVTPQHAPANNVTLVVTTESGSSLLANAYSYTSALVVSPNTAPNTAPIDVIVNGVGFQSASFGTVDRVAGAHIYLVEGMYSGSDVGGGVRANPPVQDCRNVLVLSDTEAICNLNLAARLNAAGTATLAAPAPATPALALTAVTAGSRVITAAANTFDEEDIGAIVYEATPTNFATGTSIVDVLSDTRAIVSTAAVATGTPTVGLFPPLNRTVTIDTDGTTATVDVTAGAITSADVGRYIVANGVPLGTTISAIVDADTVTLSAATTVDNTVTASIHLTTVPVPEGAYNLTYVSNGAAGAIGTDPNYVQSLISSPSTFTVAQF